MRIIRLTAVIRGDCSRRITPVTSLLDPALYPAGQLIALYARRWRLEQCLRDPKTSMGMEQLRCLSPDMADKDLLTYLISWPRHGHPLNGGVAVAFGSAINYRKSGSVPDQLNMTAVNIIGQPGVLKQADGIGGDGTRGSAGGAVASAWKAPAAKNNCSK